MRDIISYTEVLQLFIPLEFGCLVCPCGLLFYMTCKIESFFEACLRMSIPCILYAWFHKPQNTYKSVSLACAS